MISLIAIAIIAGSGLASLVAGLVLRDWVKFDKKLDTKHNEFLRDLYEDGACKKDGE